MLNRILLLILTKSTQARMLIVVKLLIFAV